MVKNLRFGKKFVASILSVGILAGATFGGLELYKKHEVNRVKGYLNDFLTEDNIVDLSCIDKSYDIKGFKGEYLYEALKGSDIKFVRIDDTYVFDIFSYNVINYPRKDYCNYYTVYIIYH